jgi:phosphoenolpyruvate synthase/pyruvate phosphate dikinase
MGKVDNLIVLRNNGFNVPNFMSLTYNELKNIKYSDILDFVEKSGTISIRSSPNKSMPGILKTFLYINTKDDSHLLKLYSELLNDDLNELYELRDLVFNNKTLNTKMGVLDQVKLSIENILKSWESDDSKYLREISKMDLGDISVIFQQMVYPGKKGGSGVCFTQHETPNYNDYYVEYMLGESGESIVGNHYNFSDFDSLNIKYYDVFKKVHDLFGAPQDIEFVVDDNGELHILQTRNLKNINTVSLNKNLTIPSIGYAEGKLTDITNFKKGDIFYSDIISTTDFNIIKEAAGVLTLKGGITSHVSNLCRLLSIPYMININASNFLNKKIILDCINGEIKLYDNI